MPANTYMAFPQDVNRSYQVSRILSLSDFGASDFTECFQAIQRIDPADDSSWNREWVRVAKLVEAMGSEAESHGNHASARFAYQRASNYYRIAADVLDPDDPQKLPQLLRARENFLKALPYQETSVEPVAIPYHDTALAGFFVKARWVEGPAPVIVWLNGADSLPEENYFNLGIPAATAGYHSLFYDHPGPGLALYEHGFGTRYDSEDFVVPAVDYVRGRVDVEAQRVILGGPSFAAYHVARGSAFEPRLAAAVSLGAMYEWKPRPGMPVRSHMLRLFGVANEAEYHELRREHFTLRGILERITCPYLVLVGTDDHLMPFPASTALRIQEELGSTHKTVRVIERDSELGGILHCQKDNLHVFQAEVFNWLNDVLNYRGPGPSAP